MDPWDPGVPGVMGLGFDSLIGRPSDGFVMPSNEEIHGFGKPLH